MMQVTFKVVVGTRCDLVASNRDPDRAGCHGAAAVNRGVELAAQALGRRPPLFMTCLL